MHLCGIDICYIVASEKPSCSATLAAACNVSGLASINLTSGQTYLHVLRNEHALLCLWQMVNCHFDL